MASLANIIQQMEGKAATNGWGAVVVLSRAALNVALQQDVIDSIGDKSFMPPFKVEAGARENAVDRFEATAIAFGEPQLSFGNPALGAHQVGMTLPIVAGNFVATHQPAGGPVTITGFGSINQAHGKYVKMVGTFTLTVGHVDGQARVILTIAEQEQDMQTNLAGENTAVNLELAALFKAKFQEVGSKSRFTLCKFNCVDYTPLSPIECVLHTQLNPDAGGEGSPDAGDGALVVFLQLIGKEGNGALPDQQFPYYIPDDKAANGKQLYTTALILARELATGVNEIPPSLAENMFFPTTATYTFWETELHRPHDLACFANLVAGVGAYTLEPAKTDLYLGDTKQFTFKDWQGRVVPADKWSVVGLDYVGNDKPEAAGSISAQGLYTTAAPAMKEVNKEVLATASVTRDSVKYSASALIFVKLERLLVTPELASLPAGANASILFSADAPLPEDTSWQLIGSSYGELVGEGNHARFTPHARDGYKALVVQQLEARNGEHTRQASVLLPNGQPLYAIAPNHATLIKKDTLTPLSHDAEFLTGARRRWTVLSGSGTVDGEGVFKAPADGRPGSTVVQCELLHNGVVFANGYSVLEMSERNAPLKWTALDKFWVRVGLDHPTGRLNTNGYQQLQVTVYVTTAAVGEDADLVPLSVSEQASIRLCLGTNDIPYVFEDYEGIEPDTVPVEDSENAGQVWRTRREINQFVRKVSSTSVEPRADNEITKTFYLQSRETNADEVLITARFQQDGGGWFRSTDKAEENNDSVEITPVRPTSFDRDAYHWPAADNADRERVDIDGQPAVNPPPDPETDPDDYNLNTIDYWVLRLNKVVVGDKKFRIARFIPYGSELRTLSMLQWESETYGEEMGSYTGFVFDSPPRAFPPVNERKEKFDSALKVISSSLGVGVTTYTTKIDAGTFVIALHRRDDLLYRNEAREGPEVTAALRKLKKPIALRLVDDEGDVHEFVFDFEGTDGKSPRNRLSLKVGL